MILQFWLAAILLLIIAAVVFVYPFVRGNKTSIKKADKISRNQLNSDLYAIRLAEIEQDDAQGLIVDKEKVIAELQHNLLDDINDAEEHKETKKGALIWVPGLLVLVIGSVALYTSVGAYKEVEKLDNVLANYETLQDKLFNDAKNRPTEQELKDIMLGLRVQLKEKPIDADGWLLYARLSMVFRNSESALGAIQKAYALDNKSVDILLVYIELKMQGGDEYDKQQAEQMVVALLKEHPEELDAWSIYAFMALQAENYELAIARWKKMLPLVGADSEKAGILRDSIAFAQKKLNTEAKSPAITESNQQQEQVAVADEPSTEQSKESAVTEGYQIKIELADNVVVPENGYLFVFANPAGTPMPAAAIRMKITTFPITVNLSDANAMMEGTKLSNYPELVIKARISPSADVSQKTGQWQGKSKILKTTDSHELTIKISESL